MELHPKDDPNYGLSQDEDEEKNKIAVQAKFGQDGLDRLKTIKQKNETDAFNYNPADQTKCPYVSHMRKTGPRNDHPNYTKHVMMRRGIPYGPWCELKERNGGVTKEERGLLFVSYQSSIDDGFRTQQKRMCTSLILCSDAPLTRSRMGQCSRCANRHGKAQWRQQPGDRPYYRSSSPEPYQGGCRCSEPCQVSRPCSSNSLP